MCLQLLGDWLEDSGWTNALVQAEIASPGTADSFIYASHVTKTRHAHQVTAASLYKLLHQAYNEHCTSEAVPPTFEGWCLQQVSEIRSLWEGNFQLYVETLTQLLPWMFALDHTHYSRWLSVHVRDMMVLSEKHPAILEEFLTGSLLCIKQATSSWPWQLTTAINRTMHSSKDLVEQLALQRILGRCDAGWWQVQKLPE